MYIVITIQEHFRILGEGFCFSTLSTRARVYIYTQFRKFKERKQKGVKRGSLGSFPAPPVPPLGHTWGTHPATALSHEGLWVVKKPDRTEVHAKGLLRRGERPVTRSPRCTGALLCTVVTLRMATLHAELATSEPAFRGSTASGSCEPLMAFSWLYVGLCLKVPYLT